MRFMGGGGEAMRAPGLTDIIITISYHAVPGQGGRRDETSERVSWLGDFSSALDSTIGRFGGASPFSGQCFFCIKDMRVVGGKWQ